MAVDVNRRGDELAELRNHRSAQHGQRRLSLHEVRASGRPAVYEWFGELLLYRDERLYDLREWPTSIEQNSWPRALEAVILDRGIGIEDGWRHLSHCRCELCAPGASAAA